MGRGKAKETVELTGAVREILAEYHPMTLRQIFYQLVARGLVENVITRYKALGNLLVAARKEGVVPWEWMEDRLRRPRAVSMWDDLADFAVDVQTAYRRDVWGSQSGYIETWLEKDALSGIFENVLNPYGCTLNVGRGYDGWDSIHNAAQRLGNGEGATILYYGDFDPSGEDMHRSLIERLDFFGCRPEIVKCALVFEDIERYNLPPAMTKKTDTRRKKFIEKNGDVCVELDALPAAVLEERIRDQVEKRMDLLALAETKRIEDIDRARLVAMLAGGEEE